jgi:hypothetical protein
MKIKTFSPIEVFIASIIVLILAFMLMISLVILNKNISRQKVFKEELSCSKSLESYIANQFTSQAKLYGVSEKDGALYVNKINSQSVQSFLGVAFLQEEEQTLKIFWKTKKVKQSSELSYTYSFYNLHPGVSIENDQTEVGSIATLVKQSDIFAGKCIVESAKNGQDLRPFEFDIINHYQTSRKAIVLKFQDKIGYTGSALKSMIFLREASEFY